jgi:hypothetical protein
MVGQDARVAETLADVKAEQLKEVPDFMGFCRMVDFSQFKVRGHYTHTERLGRYFQCLMWLGRIDVPVAGGPWKRCPSEEARMTSPRETGFAIVLWHLLNTAGQFNTWGGMERIVETFVGITDSLTFGQLNGLLSGAGIHTLADIPDLASLRGCKRTSSMAGLACRTSKRLVRATARRRGAVRVAADVHRLWAEVCAGQLGVFADGVQQHPVGGKGRNK